MSAQQQTQPMPEAPPTGPPFPVVGIGASAGGLEALTEVLQNLPPNPGLAILYVTHLEPHHKSHLQEILAKVTRLTVREVHTGMSVEPDHLFLIPPNTNMALTDGKLAITPRSPLPGQHMPIDHLFRSLADIQKNRAIGVLLSGGGTDGTLGFSAIKAEGGITIAQEEKTASQASMPRSAILEGGVDYVLPPRAIAEQIARLARHAYAREPAEAAPAEPATADVYNEILTLLRSAIDVDFTLYKPGTVHRRIQRRMALRDCQSLRDYLRLLRQDREELNSLYQDLLIRVTQFFRDPEAFDALKLQVFPALVKGRSATRPLRIWVAGCSTGEEVYSLAIALLEFMDSLPQRLPIKILATDLNEAALEKARNGTYVDNIEIDVSPERLRRFFNRVDSQYQISKSIRERCVFSRHNLATDPPFSQIDLVSCRNVLIYMDSALQKRVVPLLHYALQSNGYLVLGTSENIGTFTDWFHPVDSRHRIFRKRPAPAGHPTFDLGSFVPGGGHMHHAGSEEGAAPWSALDVQREADRIVLSRYAPVGVVVDEAMTVLQFRGRTAPYLEPAPGMASLDLFRMLREGLLAEVRGAVTRAQAENVVTTGQTVRALDNVAVEVQVIPFQVPPAGARYFVILFQDVVTAGQTEPPPPPPEPRLPADGHVVQLQQELGAMREYLQSIIEEQESTNEELKSANEEILSANEELQSTNEELQTAKEEAQSANEELATVNEELRHRNAELARVNSDLLNLLSGIGIPIVMVSRDLRIRRFTPPAEKVFNLIPSDVGRPIGDIKPNLEVSDLPRVIAGVIDSLAPFDSKVKDSEGRAYHLRVRPYVTLEKTIDGASVVLLDVDSLRRDGEGKTKR
jgi:two-component system, chemotaxis family, CheB/CheR fusion protein